MMLERLRATWSVSDRLFSILTDEAWPEQPIPLRQPFLFYLGHLPAFAWNQIGRRLLQRTAFRPEFDSLFERGIDPVGVDAYAPRASWPERDAVLQYRDCVRGALASSLDSAAGSEVGAAVAMVIEHEQMHHETLLYMVQELDHALKRRPEAWPGLAEGIDASPVRAIEVPEGETVLGADRGALPFGWDNEFPAQRIQVAAFVIDDRPVSNGDWLAFAEAGGYRDHRLWRDEDWEWVKRRALRMPHGWRREPAGEVLEPAADDLSPARLRVRTLLEDVPFERAASWPVAVSWAEAAAFTRWRRARLPSEAEWQRAAYGEPRGGARPWPWGDDPLRREHANAAFSRGSPAPTALQAAGASAWGVKDLLGNGWEWTATPFAPLPGFRPMPSYPGYSADFFDGRHFVLRGGSWATEVGLLRPSFRNWFQPHYPYVFSKLRCARTLA